MGGSGIVVAAMVVMMVLMAGGMILGLGGRVRRGRRQHRRDPDTDAD